MNYNLSTRNDLDLVLNHMKEIKFENKWICHSDHGFQYSAKKFVETIEQNNGVISMGEVGKSLDNREAEYFFSIIKSEYLSHFDVSKITFNELRERIDDFINWYNTKRPQSILNWKTPQEAWDALA